MQCFHKIQLKTGDIVPCGKCPACLANQRQEWVFRLKQEYLASRFALFVTLTYDEEHCPKDMCVNKKDVQDFHKRLRKHFPSRDLRFYLVSEYGDHTFRPHYHGLYFFKSDYKKEDLYDIFENSWKNGFCSFGDVEEGSIVYCTKYCLKHKIIPPGRTETFRLVSKMNGGLGINYLQKMQDYHEKTQNFSFVSYGGKTCRMPRYFRGKCADQRSKQHQFDESYDLQLDDFRKRYRSYLQLRMEQASTQTERDFLAYEQNRFIRRDDLILKHTKKQKL